MCSACLMTAQYHEALKHLEQMPCWDGHVSSILQMRHCRIPSSSLPEQCIIRMTCAIDDTPPCASYARTSATYLQVELISSLEDEHARLLKLLPKHLQDHYWSRHAEASQEGDTSGRWVFPPLILDEEAFRQDLLDDDDCTGLESSEKGQGNL